MIVVAQSMGQLGNRLIQFSHLIAFSRDHGVSVANPAFSLYPEFFDSTQNDLLCRYPPRSGRWVSKTMQRLAYYLIRTAAATRLLSLVPNSIWVEQHWTTGEYDLGNAHFVKFARTKRFVFLTGSWMHRYHQGLERHLDAVRQHFQLVPELRARIIQFFEPIQQTADVVIGVHIRQGDNASDPIRRDAFTTEQYANVMRKAAALFPDKQIVFLVCSDRTQSESAFPNLRIFHGPGAFIEDMYVLAECDYIMELARALFRFGLH